jgi:hypothetical protein
MMHVETGDHFACIFPIPFLAYNLKFNCWFFPNFIIFIASYGFNVFASTYYTGTIDKFFIFGNISLAVTS